MESAPHPVGVCRIDWVKSELKTLTFSFVELTTNKFPVYNSNIESTETEMFQTKSINSVFKEDNLPVELVKCKDYFYFTYDLPEQKVFETESVYVQKLGHLTKDEWIRQGRVFAVETEHKFGINR